MLAAKRNKTRSMEHSSCCFCWDTRWREEWLDRKYWHLKMNSRWASCELGRGPISKAFSIRSWNRKKKKDINGKTGKIKVKPKSESCSVVSDSLLPPGLYSPWNLQARILAWVAFPSPGDLPLAGAEPRSRTLRADSSPAGPQGNTWGLVRALVVFFIP